MENPVIIVGGGVAGLATAFELHRLGVSFVLLEAATRAGGVVLSEDIDGYTIDAGPDSLLVQKPAAIKLCEELGLGNRLISTKPPRFAYVQRGGTLHPLPSSSVLGIPTRIGPFVRTDLFSWHGKLRMGAELFVPARRDEADESIAAFVRRRFGREAATYLAEPLLAGIHAGDADRLSVAALFPRFVETERRYGSLLRGFRRQLASGERQRSANGGAFRSLPGGLSEMVRALVGSLPAGSVRLRSPTVGIRMGRGSLSVPAASSGSTLEPAGFSIEMDAGRSLDAMAIVLATPAHVTAKLLRQADPELADECGAIPYASTATIALAFPRDAVNHPLNGTGFVVPRVEGTGILAASWLSSKWPDRAPEGKVLMRTFVGGARDPKALERSDDELVAVSLKALGPIIGLSGKPLLTRVYRWERASAQLEVGHPARRQAIERKLALRPGLFLTGSAFGGVGIPDCVADGRRVARQVVAWLQTAAVRGAEDKSG